jgi:hypothetical protein
MTVRIPAALKRGLEARARKGRRSLSAQVLHDLDMAVSAAVVPAPGRFLGIHAGTRLPTDAEIDDVRARFWARLGGTLRHE